MYNTVIGVCTVYRKPGGESQNRGNQADRENKSEYNVAIFLRMYVTVCTEIQKHNVDHKSHTTLFLFVVSYGFKAVQEEELCVWASPIFFAL